MVIARLAHLPLIAVATWLCTSSSSYQPVITLAVSLPFAAIQLGRLRKHYLGSLAVLAAAVLALFLLFILTKPPNLFELLGVRPDVMTSLPLRIRLNKLVASSSSASSPELIQAGRALVDDERRRTYIVHGPGMHMDFAGLGQFVMQSVVLLASLASRQDDPGGAGTLLLGLLVVFSVAAVEIMEKLGGPVPAISLAQLPLLCTFEIVLLVRLLAVCVLSLGLFHASYYGGDALATRRHKLAQRLDWVIEDNDALITFQQEEDNKVKHE